MKSVFGILIFSLGFSVGLESGQFNTECKKGEVRDLDGKCVKKVLFPDMTGRRKTCPEPYVQNGNYFLRREGRMVEYFCDTDFIRVPDIETSICRITGEWSKQIPVCLKSGCQGLPAPDNGEVLLEYSSSLAIFSCNNGYQLKGAEYVGCTDGTNWNDTEPVCEFIIVPTTTPKPILQKSPKNSIANNAKIVRFDFKLLSMVIFMAAVFQAK